MRSESQPKEYDYYSNHQPYSSSINEGEDLGFKTFKKNLTQRLKQKRNNRQKKKVSCHGAKCNRRFKLSDFQIGYPIARGGFGKVYLARTRKEEFIVALKVLFKERIMRIKQEHLVAREIEIQLNLDHPNIIQLYDYFWDEKRVFLIMEYASHGDLFNYIHGKEGGRISERRAAGCVYQMALALEHLHEKGLVHRDLKPENIVINHDGVLKLADFGWAVSVLEKKKRKTFCGTLDYLAPELVQKRRYSTSIDIWTLGVLAYELVRGQAPFTADDESDTKKMIDEIEYVIPDTFSKELTHFLGCIFVESRDRINIKGVLKHEWVLQGKGVKVFD